MGANVELTWRTWKWVGVALFLVALSGCIWSADLYYQYQGTLPRHSNPATGNVYPLNVHGIVVYQTRDERNWLNEVLYSSIAVAAASGLMALIYRKKFGRPPTRPLNRSGPTGG
jgi:hypothetical protein